MYQFKNQEDTIAAISTAMGTGGIGIVRLSGKDALDIADQMFESKTGALKPSELRSHTVRHGFIVRDGGVVDEVLLTVMRSPRTYTCEDVVEISSHGGIVPLKAILRFAIDLGARLAEPGEFTKRAFLHGRIDLTQAEAVLDIIQSKTESFLRVSTHQLKGELAVTLQTIRDRLMTVYVELEAIVNFPEDEIDQQRRLQIHKAISEASGMVDQLLQTSEQGKIFKEGIKIVLCGRANVGKSSLLNAFLKQPRAIVSHIEGTTRDIIEETAQIKGIPFQLVDTAGILEPRDFIEEEAVKRSHLNIQSADLILFLLDASRGFQEDDEELLERIKGQNVFVVVNKSDLKSSAQEQNWFDRIRDSLNSYLPDCKVVAVSALTRNGIDQLEDDLYDTVLHGRSFNRHGILVSNMRHVNSLKSCLQAIERSARSMEQGLSAEFVSEDIKSAVNDLDAITGRNIDNDLLDQIFSEFCIGK